MREIPKPYEVYKHFKGNYYQIMSIATHSETGEKMVVYQQLYAPFGMYVRPLEMFMSEIDRAKYPDVRQTYRFEKTEPVSPQISCLYEKTSGKNVTQVSDVETAVMKAAGEGETAEKVKAAATVIEQPQEEMLNIHPGLLAFLEADTYEEKLDILRQLHSVITNEMIDTMAVSLDTEIKEGDIEQRYNEMMNCLLTMERFECNRLR